MSSLMTFDRVAPRLFCPLISQASVLAGCHFSSRIFLTQGVNLPVSPALRQILYSTEPQGSPWMHVFFFFKSLFSYFRGLERRLKFIHTCSTCCLMGSPQNPQFSTPVLLMSASSCNQSSQNGRQTEMWLDSWSWKTHFPKCFWPVVKAGMISLSIIVWLSCVDWVHTAQPHSPSLVPSDETRVPTNRRFLFSHPGINRKISWDCGLRTPALPPNVFSPFTENWSHCNAMLCQLSQHKKSFAVVWGFRAANYI